ncbi:5' nucleotidase, NT5C type [Methylocella sp.]|uniref:5' nucleotidase, NT5C type n=1 Tax=Methylocella sp. TaxID=1978226 RepID=UPI0037844E60
MPETIAVDLDDTLIDTNPALFAWVEATRGAPVDPADAAAYRLAATEAETLALISAFYDAPEHDALAALAGAREACAALKGAGARLVVVTARRPEAAGVTERLVERLFAGLFAEVRAVGDEPDKVRAIRAAGAGLLIDDNARQIRRAAAAGVPTILFGDLPWNRALAWPRRAASWAEVGGLVAAGS